MVLASRPCVYGAGDVPALPVRHASHTEQGGRLRARSRPADVACKASQ